MFESVTFLFVVFDEERIYRIKLDTSDELPARILTILQPAQSNVKINSDEQHAIFAHESQSALSVTLGF
jgi:hypothetical protein